MNIYTNSNYRKDILSFEMEKWGEKKDILIATAFFSEADFIKKLISNNCNIKLLVRLSEATSGPKLNEIIYSKNVSIRYFTSSKFHPKFYIFGDDIAFLGSSNLTNSGINRNNEANISIDSETGMVEELKSIFYKFWESANVLDNDILKKYLSLEEQYEPEINNARKEYNKKFKEIIPEAEFDDKNWNKKNITKSKQFIEQFKRKYQLFLNNFDILKQIYQEHGIRKADESKLPIRMEVDQFLNWIREKRCHGDDYNNASRREGKEREQYIIKYIKEFVDDSTFDFFNHIVEYSYPKINDLFSSPEKIKTLTKNELSDGLKIIHSFSTHAQRQSGGIDFRTNEFIDENGIDKIKQLINYLMFNTEENYILRIAKCIHDPQLSLNNFKDSCVKELYGWLNDQDIPTYNSRIYKSMRWLGFTDWK